MNGLFERKPARNVYHALNWCNPKSTIADWLEEFYVDRGETSPIEEIKEHLLSELENPKIILAGPRGCGKVTEMLKLSDDSEIRRHFYVKFFPGAVDISILIAKMLQNVVDIAKEVGLAQLEDVREANDFLLFRTSWNEIVEVTAVPERDVFNERWVDNSRYTDKRATVTKKKPADVEPLTMTIWINNITAQIKKKKRKDVLLVVVGMDKMEADKVITLFKEKVVPINGIKCFIIFTAPAELYFNPNINVIRRNYSEIYFLPNFYAWKRGNELAWNYDRMRHILLNRVSYELLDRPEPIIEQLIHYSGGVPYELLDLARHCALISSRQVIHWLWYYKPFWYIWIFFFSPKRQKIKLEDLEDRVIQRRRRIYENSLTDDQKKLLLEIKNKETSVDLNDPKHKELYDNNLIILYGPEKKMFFEVNPIIDILLDNYSSTVNTGGQQVMSNTPDAE
ncbi:hypothetical protein JXB12_01130 [candidate division KSB1 bacterium]|nr:hypothetical protein [candidate division KSB1 bacterium]